MNLEEIHISEVAMPTKSMRWDQLAHVPWRTAARLVKKQLQA